MIAVADVSGDGERLDRQFEEVAKQGTQEMARKWHSRADQLLLKRGDNFEFEVFPIVQGSVPPVWVESEGAWVFHYPHAGAPHLEFGADPHKIEAKQAEYLAFEWPEMEGVEFGDTGQTFDEVFADSWPTVFFKEVEHPGIPALKFVTDAWKDIDSP